jgi:hypothetical protein
LLKLVPHIVDVLGRQLMRLVQGIFKFALLLALL